MHVTHLVLTSPDCPSPTWADAQRIQDCLWAQAPRDLGIEHISAKVRQGHIEVILFCRSTVYGGMPDESAALATIRNLPFLGIWRVILAGGEMNENDPPNRFLSVDPAPGSMRESDFLRETRA